VSEIVWARVTSSENAPPWFPPMVFGLMGASLVFLLYLSPKRASKQIDQLTVGSIWNVQNLTKDIELSKTDIARINFQRTRVRDPGRGCVKGSMFTLTLKNGERFSFVNTLKKDKHERLLQLFQTFASQAPPTNFIIG